MTGYQNKTNKTKNQLRKALLELLKEESITQISTSQIARKAELNRVTFYRHFDDKWDILESIENDFLNQLLTPHSNLRLKLQTTHDLTATQPAPELLVFLNVFRENLDLLKILMASGTESNFTHRLMKQLLRLEQLSHPYLKINHSTAEKELFSYATISSLLGMIQFWINHPEYSTKEIADFFFKMRIGTIKELNKE
ncbi:MAG: TetR/AcrR family transcriptional regulator [Enterococcus sp.]